MYVSGVFKMIHTIDEHVVRFRKTNGLYTQYMSKKNVFYNERVGSNRCCLFILNEWELGWEWGIFSPWLLEHFGDIRHYSWHSCPAYGSNDSAKYTQKRNRCKLKPFDGLFTMRKSLCMHIYTYVCTRTPTSAEELHEECFDGKYLPLEKKRVSLNEECWIILYSIWKNARRTSASTCELEHYYILCVQSLYNIKKKNTYIRTGWLY